MNPTLPQIFHTIFRQAYLPYNDPETLKSFLKIIDQFEYDHSERLGDAFEYLLSVLGSQGDAGQFRTPRHIIDFMVDIVEPKIGETILDPACGTAGFLISAYKYILRHNSSEGKSNGDLLTPDQRKQLAQNICGYDISPDMVRLSLVNMYLHRITEPRIAEYDTLTSDAKWNEYFDVILANPPFMSPKGGIKPHARFSIQSKRSEALFVDYIIEHLTKTGRGAVIVPEGVIFKTDTAFVKLRKMLINDNYLYGVISLPQGVFNPYSGVKTSILLFDKVIARLTDKILFAKVENDGFSLGAQRRPIEGSQLESIASAIKDIRTKIHRNEECVSNTIISLVNKSQIANTADYDLSVERYIQKTVKKSIYPQVKLGDVCNLYQPKTITSSELIEDGEYVVYGANGIIGRYDKYNHDEPEVIITCRGATCGTINITTGKCWITGNAMVAQPMDTSILDKLYLYYILVHSDLSLVITGAAQPQITRSSLKEFLIPLPSITDQYAIVKELDNYQKIIDAAKTIVDNYKPQIDIDPSWPMVALGEIIKLSSGNGLTSRQIVQGDYPVYGGNGLIGLHNQYFVENPTIVIGRVGAYCGSIHITQPKSWITDNGLYVVNIKRPVLLEYLAIMLKDLNLHQYAKIGGQPSISQSVVYDKQIPLPDINIQKEIVSQLNKEQKYIDNAKELINVFTEKMNKRIAKIWNE